jgi:hypothetical protein
MGIEPTLAAWEAAVLPLNYTRAVASLCPAEARWQSVAPARIPEKTKGPNGPFACCGRCRA